MKRHVNIPVFIPHLGCPNQCVFCNQRSISGIRSFEAKNVIPTIEAALDTIQENTETEIAFFGGSFTGIDRGLMIELLEIAHSYIVRGKVSSIRCSTRPDYIDNEVLSILKCYGVRVIELGLQSISDEVLSVTKRGHTAKDCARACRAILDHGFELVGQMMIGLPLSTEAREIETAKFIIQSGASAARIYPTVVFKETELCGMAVRNEYSPISLDDAVVRSAKVLREFIDAGVEVIRIGLCASENLSSEETYFAGPNHAALGELVENRLYYEAIIDQCRRIELSGVRALVIKVAPGALSKAIGQKRINKTLLQKELGVQDIRFREDISLAGYEFKIESER